ncbi:MAG: glycosyltransferase family 4 protein, partial [Phycisphaerales bacterium]|nr:glycosyltransferase family 4 protein [Phycisphaerales bacterium]
MSQAASDTKGRKRRTFLIFSQVYPPDPASVGQHMHDVAKEMVRRGWRVRVIAANRGYDDASIKYRNFEVMDGVEVRRVPFSSFGKKSLILRAVAMGVFMCFCLYAGLITRRLACILTSTSPPMCAFAAGVCHTLRRVPIKYWVMDLNPDQMIAMGKITENSLPARLFNFLNRRILKRSRGVVALDRFMAERLNRKVPASVNLDAKMSIQPPWPHEGHVEVVAHADNPFRKAHGLDGKFVVMYSGNHAPSNPLKTLLEAAARLKDDPRFVFMFIGGGLLKKDVEAAIAAGATNIRSLPYQPMSELKYSLSAADVHVVSIGNDVVGIVHPCKVYGAMAVARPILF